MLSIALGFLAFVFVAWLAVFVLLPMVATLFMASTKRAEGSTEPTDAEPLPPELAAFRDRLSRQDEPPTPLPGASRE